MLLKRLWIIPLLMIVLFSACSAEKVESGGEVPFTNKQGSPESECAYVGCKSPVARTGDTAYCEAHSAKCIYCGCWIDPDLTACDDCMMSRLETAEPVGEMSWHPQFAG